MKKADESRRPSPRAAALHGARDGWPVLATVAAQSGGAALYDWTTDGGDNQRTGWNKNEKTLTKDNVKNLKLLWKLADRQSGPRAAFADAGAGPRAAEHAGGHEAGRLSSAASPTTSMRSTSKREDPLAETLGLCAASRSRRRRRARRTSRRIRRISASCARAAAATRRSSAPPTRRAAGRSTSSPATACSTRSNAATGEDLQPAFMFHTGKGWALNLVGQRDLDGEHLRRGNALGGQARRSVAHGHELQRGQRRRVGPPRRGDRFDRRRVDDDRRRHLRPDERSPAIRATASSACRSSATQLKLKDYYTPTQLGLAAEARSGSEQHADDLQLQGTRADGRVGQGMPGVPARSEVARRRRIIRRRCSRRRCSATRKSTSRTPAAGARCRRGRTRAARGGCSRRSGVRRTRRRSSRS